MAVHPYYNSIIQIFLGEFRGRPSEPPLLILVEWGAEKAGFLREWPWPITGTQGIVYYLYQPI